MDIPPSKSRHLLPAVLPEELIAEILSFLSVKTLTQLRCVSKSWNTLISDPIFVKKHLNRSSRNPHLTLMWELYRKVELPNGCIVVPFPVRRLLENPSIKIPAKSGHRLKNLCRIIGSCNGLICLFFYSFHRTTTAAYRKNWFCFWNPATRTRSENLGLFRDYTNPMLGGFKFTFCCVDSTGVYKVVAFRAEGDEESEASWKSEVRVFNLGDNCWKKIQSFPIIPLNWLDIGYNRLNDGVHFSGTVNWLALRMISRELNLSLFLDCLCFSHDFKGTEFVVWQMKEYGVQESWTQLLRVNYQNLDWGYFGVGFQLLCLSENADVMILASQFDHRPFIYHRKENRAERTNITNRICWFTSVDYVESLVSTH